MGLKKTILLSFGFSTQYHSHHHPPHAHTPHYRMSTTYTQVHGFFQQPKHSSENSSVSDSVRNVRHPTVCFTHTTKGSLVMVCNVTYTENVKQTETRRERNTLHPEPRFPLKMIVCDSSKMIVSPSVFASFSFKLSSK